jgi:curved DNA-binding protein CbpA
MQYDYYKLLGIDHQASTETIKRAYYEKAKQYHPDINHQEGAELVFKLLNEAYQTLINPQRRKKYDFRLHYGSMIEYTRTTAQSQTARSARYDAYVKQKKEEARAEIRANRRMSKAINMFVFWTMAAILSIGLLFSLLDAWINYNFRMLLFIFVFIAVFVGGLIYLRKKSSSDREDS